jgi:hypothetical protein
MASQSVAAALGDCTIKEKAGNQNNDIQNFDQIDALSSPTTVDAHGLFLGLVESVENEKENNSNNGSSSKRKNKKNRNVYKLNLFSHRQKTFHQLIPMSQHCHIDQTCGNMQYEKLKQTLQRALYVPIINEYQQIMVQRQHYEST